MNNYEFILFDKIEKIKQIDKLFDLKNNSFISFSGGKDSTILHYLIDKALPNNNIPRIFANTGIEYIEIVKYVKELQKKDNRIIIVNQTRNIKQTLNKYGYPFKSKEFSCRVETFNKGQNPPFLQKFLDENNKSKYACPKQLRYIFEEKGKYNFSRQCCNKLKKDLIKPTIKKLNKTITITGMRQEESGNRERLPCLTHKNTKFNPLATITEEWINEFIKKENITLCKLYYAPYNFKRTGCKGCPYNPNIDQDLLTLRIYLPNEYKQCEILWRPIYTEYRRIGYRLKINPKQLTIYDLL